MNKRPFVSFFGLQMPRSTWMNFRWDFMASIVFSLFNVVFNQFYVPMAIRHGASDLHVGLLTAAPAIGLLFSPLWAGISERSGAMPFMIYPNLIGRLLIMIPAFFVSPWVFVMTALAFQLLMGMQAPAYASIMTRIYPSDLRGRLMGNVRVAMGIWMIPLAYLVGHWIDTSGSAMPLLAASITGAISILIFTMIKGVEPTASSHQPASEGRKNPISGIRRISLKEQLQMVRGNRGLLFFFAATTLSGFGNMLANPLYNIIQVDRLDLSNLEIGYIRMSYYACLLLSYLILGWIIDRFSPHLALTIGIGAYAVVPFLYGVLGTFPAVIAAGGIQGIGEAAWDIGCMAYVFRMAPGKEGIVFGLHLMLFGIRGTIGPLLSTSLGSHLSLEPILLTASFCSLAGFIVFQAKHARTYPVEEQTGV